MAPVWILLPIFLVLTAAPLASDSIAQRNPAFYGYPYNHLEWYTIESEQFMVHFQEGNSRPAQVVSRIAEEVYGPITELYGHEPDHKVSILIIDRLDYSNGAAFFYDNKIEIWLPALDTPLRGTHNWLRNVITHEFTHIVQLQASMKKSRRHPASYIQWLSYEDVRRPDVLYGFPNGIITYPLAGISMPAWLAEGTAQYMREEIYYDFWDTHRDMLLRTRILDSNWLSLEKMGTFSSKTSLERELVYNQGFAFTHYLADRFGEKILADITQAFSQSGIYDVSKAIREATGVDGDKVFDEWIEELSGRYSRFAEGRDANPENRTWVEPLGFFNFHPKYHPDGSRIAYLSNKMMDGAISSLYFMERDSLFRHQDGENGLSPGSGSSSGNSTDHGTGSSSLSLELFGETATVTHQDHTRFSGLTRTSTRNISGRNRTVRNQANRNAGRHGPAAHASHGTGHTAVQPGHPHEYHLESTPLRRLETTFSYSPDGSRIAYSRARINSYGERYRDLYIYEPDSGDSKRLTFSERLQDPAWSPDDDIIAAGKIEDGTINLFLYDLARDSLIRITDFRHGEQFYSPAWHPNGTTLYTAYADTAHRGIYKISLSDTSGPDHTLTPVLTDRTIDFRDPVVSQNGQWLYFSADQGGVFNIHRMSLEDGTVQRVTNVVGGAFMPYPHPDPEKEEILYSEYVSTGYKIALLDLSETDLPVADLPVPGLAETDLPVAILPGAGTETGKSAGTAGDTGASQRADADAGSNASVNNITLRSLNRFDDTDIDPLSEYAVAVADTGTYRYQLPTRGSSSERTFYRYTDQFTSFQFYPVLRFDNYSRLRGSNTTLLTEGRLGDLGANMWRDVKVGAYFASREMRERLSIFGGALFGPGSRSSDGISNFFRPGRLVNLDRDLFLEAEYAGLPFIKRHWSPTVSVAFFNIRRNVQDGLQIEEFPCTACLPDTTSTDIAYNMWQVEVNLISKINRWSLIELGYYYSPYRVSTDSFFSREFRQEVSGSTSRYFIGSTWTGAWIFDLSLPDRHGDIAPMGWKGLLRYSYEPSELLDSYDIRDGTLVPVYNTFENHSVEADVRIGFMLKRQRFNMRTRFFTYFDSPDEFFFLDYIGGMTGMRSYPFFALGGNTTTFSTLSWFLPLRTGIYRQMGRLTLDKVFLRLFAEAGNGWGGPLNIDKSIKTGVGAELRIGMNSYYFFPTSFFISSAYGFNAYDLQLPDAFITETPTGRVTYGNQILINFGILFDFEF